MVHETFRDIFRTFLVYRAREIQRTARRRTVREMTRLPEHLLDDVNARGLPAEPGSPLSLGPHTRW